MPYSQSKSHIDTEKKLQSLRMQLYGKEVKPTQKSSVKYTPQVTKSTNTTTTRPENNYLKRDLLKTVVLATVAITTQLVLKFIVIK